MHSTRKFESNFNHQKHQRPWKFKFLILKLIELKSWVFFQSWFVARHNSKVVVLFAKKNLLKSLLFLKEADWFDVERLLKAIWPEAFRALIPMPIFHRVMRNFQYYIQSKHKPTTRVNISLKTLNFNCSGSKNGLFWLIRDQISHTWLGFSRNSGQNKWSFWEIFPRGVIPNFKKAIWRKKIRWSK